MHIDPRDAWQHLDSLTKPPRSLGRLEELAVRLCGIQGTLAPLTKPRRLVLFAGDHGVVAAGVTAWPSDVTRLMIGNICAGAAASTIFAQQTGTETVLVNVGALDGAGLNIRAPAAGAPIVQYRDARIRSGTRNLAEEPALTADEFTRALEVGGNEARAAASEGMRVVLAGEMGIGNTTPAACLAMLLADLPLAEAVGRGAGADDATLARKRSVVADAVERSRAMRKADPVAAIAAVSGLEIAAMAGFYAAAHTLGLTVLLDGYVASSAALIAERLQPGSAKSLIAAHLSAEPGHRRVLTRLGLEPFLDWNMRLGEGTGALLLLPLVDSAAEMTLRMATLADLGIAPEPPIVRERAS